MGIGKDWESFFDQKITQSETQDLTDSKFDQVPVPSKEFFDIWMQQSLYPEQQKAIDQVFSPDYRDINDTIKEVILYWGEGSGKDFFTTRLMVYVAYWLLCLKDPQKYLGTTAGTPIDIANTSINEAHASDIFFKQFCNALQRVKNPSTGKNWFEEQGMDLRDGRDILNTKVKFPKNLTAYSLNSVKYAGEGKNVLLGVLDEIAEFRFDRAKNLYSNLKSTALSRFPKHHKIILISYLRDEFDFMETHCREVELWKPDQRNSVYISKKCTWEVNIARKREDYQSAYDADKEDAARRFENVLPKMKNTRFLKDPERILKCLRSYDIFPLISETPHWTEDILEETFQPWVKPFYTKELQDLEEQYIQTPNDELKKRIEMEKERHLNAQYFIHIDLSKGAVDYAGFVMVHNYMKTPSQVGYYLDMAIQLRPKGKEINFEDIRKFIFKLVDQGYPIAKVTLDGWNSVDFLQLLERKGIPCELVSVDRTQNPYNTLKDILYQGMISLYYNPILIRELTELIVTNNKIDHPRESNQRLQEEGLKPGSKDLADGLAGAVYQAVTFGDAPEAHCTSGEEDPGDMINRMFGR